MIAELKPYPRVKDSGVEWLGEVPEHWEVRRSKYLLRERDSRSVGGSEQLLRVSQFTGVTERRREDGGAEPDTRASSLVGYKCVAPNDLVVNIMLAWNGSLGVSRFAGITSPAYCVYRFTPRVEPWYFHYLLRSPAYKARIKSVSTGVVESRLRLYTDDLYRLEAPLPPVSEQAAIVRFLDYADRRIRRYIRAKQKLIRLLEEQKQAIIHRAVTRGLDPDVPLKDSGVEWLGEVPEHWELMQLSRVLSSVTSGSRGWAQYYSDTGDIFIQSGNLGRTMSLDFSHTQHVQAPPGTEGERTRVKRNDVLVCITGALTGNIVFVDRDFPVPAYINQHVALLRTTRCAVSPRYLAFALYSEIGRVQFKTSEYGGTKQGLGLDDLKSALVPLPPIEEQRRIYTYLDAHVDGLAAASASAAHEISLLRELRTRLIADVVTGKLDVREAATRLPDDDDTADSGDDDDVDLEAELEAVEA
jgi:type I restriction enzyme S subunit